MTSMPLTRLSDKFVLLDFLYGHGTYTRVTKKIELSSSITDKNLQEGKQLCENLLEPIVDGYGPISIAEGLRMRGVPKETSNTPHEWTCSFGAAADIVVHDWVNDGKAPINFLRDLSRKRICYQRAFSYFGSEYCCMAHRTQEMDFCLGEYRLEGGETRLHYLNKKGCEKWNKIANESPPSPENWRREPYKHYHGREKVVRPWHVRVSRYFVLHDFCRNEKTFSLEMSTVPELNERTAKSEIKVARMMGEVLDPVKKHLGNISVVRGWEPEGFVKDAEDQDAEHHWTAGRGKRHSVRFVTPVNPDEGYLDLLKKNDRVSRPIRDPEKLSCGAYLVHVRIEDFDPHPSRCRTSASGAEYPWELEA